MDVAEFEAKEKGILDGIREKGKTTLEKGLLSGVPAEGNSLVGYLIALRFKDNEIRQIEDFSARVRESVAGRAITYNRANLHQTIADYGVQTIQGESFEPDSVVLRKLDSLATRATSDYLKNYPIPCTAFDTYVHGPDSVILIPNRNIGNPHLIDIVEDEANKDGVKIRPAWGRHTTVNRFTENVPADELGRFHELMLKEKGYKENGFLTAISLDVGYFVINKNGFDFEVLGHLGL